MVVVTHFSKFLNSHLLQNNACLYSEQAYGQLHYTLMPTNILPEKKRDRKEKKEEESKMKKKKWWRNRKWHAVCSNKHFGASTAPIILQFDIYRTWKCVPSESWLYTIHDYILAGCIFYLPDHNFRNDQTYWCTRGRGVSLRKKCYPCSFTTSELDP